MVLTKEGILIPESKTRVWQSLRERKKKQCKFIVVHVIISVGFLLST